MERNHLRKYYYYSDSYCGSEKTRMIFMLHLCLERPKKHVIISYSTIEQRIEKKKITGHEIFQLINFIAGDSVSGEVNFILSPPSSSSSFITISRGLRPISLIYLWYDQCCWAKNFERSLFFVLSKSFVVLLSRWFERTLCLKKTVNFMPRWLERISGFCPTSSTFHFASCFCPESHRVAGRFAISSSFFGGRSNIFFLLSLDGRDTCCCMKRLFFCNNKLYLSVDGYKKEKNYISIISL